MTDLKLSRREAAALKGAHTFAEAAAWACLPDEAACEVWMAELPDPALYIEYQGDRGGMIAFLEEVANRCKDLLRRSR